MNRATSRVLAALAVLITPAVSIGAVGKTPGAFSVSPTGSATYNVPIWVPPGPRGLQPSISVVYNSSGGLSTLGPGWAISGLSAITRCNKTFAEDGLPSGITLTTADAFCLDGVRLRLTSSNTLSTYGQPNTTYQPETGSLSNVTASGAVAGTGPASFTVQTRNGTTYEYGVGGNSQVLAASGTAIAWMLDKVTDPAGNTVVIAYKAPDASLTGSTVPDTISWTPTTFGASTYLYQMKFDYTANASQSTDNGYVAGNVVKVAYLLNDIKVLSSGTVVRQYVFGYELSPTTQGSRLNQIKECSDNAASDCLAPTTITYQNGQAGLSTTANSPLTTVVPSMTTHHDFNGDGYPDLAYSATTGAWSVKFGSASGFGAAVATGTSGSVAFGDLTASGQDGILWSSGGTWTYYVWNGASFVSQGTFGTVEANTQQASLTDVDGDGKPELVALRYTSNASTYTTTVTVRPNTSIGATPSLAAPVTAFTDSGSNVNNAAQGPLLAGPDNQMGPLKFFDFNGDGRQDLAYSQTICQAFIPNPGGGLSCFALVTTFRELIAQGTSASPGFSAVIGGSTSSTSPTLPPQFVNWNNDACTDIEVYDLVVIAGCNGTVQTSQTSAGGVIGAVDYDGDGRTDLVETGSGVLRVQLSTGSGLAAPINTTVPWGSSCNPVTLDADADGLDDLGTLCQTGTPGFTYYNHNQPGVQPDLVASITDGYGVKVLPTYVALTRAPSGVYTNTHDATAGSGYKDFIGPTYVVSSYTQSDGTGNPASTSTVDLAYAGAWMSTQGLGFTGFSSKRVRDSRDQLYRYEYYSRQFPYIGMLSGTELRQSDNLSTKWISQTTNTFDDLQPTVPITGGTFNDRHFPYVKTSTTNRREFLGTLDNQPISTTATTITLDAFGATKTVVTTVTDTQSGSPFGAQVWETDTDLTLPTAHTSDWCLDLPTVVTVTRKLGASTIATTQNLTVDRAKCRVTQTVTAPNDPTYQVTQLMAFDSFGNVASTTVTGQGMTARVSTTDWNSTGQFPVTIKNPLANSLGTSGYKTVLTYDTANLGWLMSQKVQSADGTVDNAPAAAWDYDSFGRVTKVTAPDGTATSRSWSLCAPSCLNSAHKMTMIESDLNSDQSTLTDRKVYFDAYGRSVIADVRLLDGTYSRTESQFDAFGRVAQESSPCLVGSCTTYWTQYFYDVLGRTTEIRRPTSAVDSQLWQTFFQYAGRTVTTTDALAHASSKAINVVGLVGQSIDANSYQQNFGYDAAGSLVSVTDSLSTLFTASYDYGIGAFQRDVTDMDLDVVGGTHRHFNYNALGELASWTDAKGQNFSMSYDLLSRPTQRLEVGLTTNWTWGTSAALHEIGQLNSVTAGTYREDFHYDPQARLVDHAITIPSDPHGPYHYAYTYDGTTQLLATQAYPTTYGRDPEYQLVLQYGYQNGILKQISDGTTVYWTADQMNAAGQITQETLGTTPTATITTRDFDALTGWTNFLHTGAGNDLQNESYLHDKLGNLIQRQNGRVSLTETFEYDTVDRLKRSTLGGNQNLALTYANNGNILSRTDVGGNTTWSYDSARRHAVTQAGTGGPAYDYDANGNVAHRNGSAITWTSFNKPVLISGANGESVGFDYNQDHQRWRATYTIPGGGTETTYFVGGDLETVVGVGVTHYRHYIYAGGTKVAIVDVPTTGSIATNYIREDHQGSTECVIASDGTSVVKESFTAFGARRNACTWDGPPTNGMLTRINSVTRRGYTWQNALGAMGLNDMNGRIEDAVTGRFLSADPYVPDPGNPQSFNRYSYALNNPLTYTDPSGFAQLPSQGTGDTDLPTPLPKWCDLAPSCPGGVPSFPDFPSFPSIPGWDGVNGGCPFGHPAVCQAYIDLLNWYRDHPQPTPPTPPTPNPGYVKGPTVTPVAKGPQTRQWWQSDFKLQTCKTSSCQRKLLADAGADPAEYDRARAFHEDFVGGLIGGVAGGATSVGKNVVADLGSKQIIQSVAREEFAKGLQYLKGFMSGPEQGLLNNPKLAGAVIGKAVHEATAKALDGLYPGRFEYFRTKGMDFVDKTNGELIELTKKTQEAYKRWKYGVGADQVATYP